MSQRVVGHLLKSGVAMAGLKQVRAFGCPIGRGQYLAVFKGKGASSLWRQRRVRMHDGSFDMSATSAQINYPALPDNGYLSRREADLFAAFTLHEVGHVAYTDYYAPQELGIAPASIAFGLFNGIEDARMEHAVIKSGKARGSRSMFKRLLNHLIVGLDLSQWNPCSLDNAPFALALICRAALGNGNHFSRGLLARIPEPKRALYKAAADAMAGMALDRSGSKQAGRAAVDFLNAWKQIEQVKPQAEPQPQPDGSGMGDDGASEQKSLLDQQGEMPEADGDFGDNDEQPAPQEPKQAKAGESDDDAPGSYLPDDDDDSQQAGDDSDDDSDDDSQSAGAGGDDDDDDSDDDGEGAGGAGDDDDDLDAGDLSAADSDLDGDGGSDSGSASDAGGEEDEEGEGAGSMGGEGKSFEDNGQPNDGSNFKSPEPDISNMAKRISKRTPQPLHLPAFCSSRREKFDPNAYSGNIQKVPVFQSSDDAHNVLMKDVPAALRAQIARLLAAPERRGWDSGSYSGRFDVKKQSRMFSGSESVFKKRWETEGVNTALEIIVDMSGSMSERAQHAFSAAYAIACAAESAGCKVQVSGFGGGFAQYPDRYLNGMDGTGGKSTTVGRAGASSELTTLKQWHEKSRAKADVFVKAIGQVCGGTPDYPCIRTAAEEMAHRRENRKMILVLTDGMGHVNEMEVYTRHVSKLIGVEIIGIAIGMLAPGSERVELPNGGYASEYGSNDFIRAYQIGEFCPDSKYLSEVAMRRLNKSVSKGFANRRVL
jgi:cobalamin biosynthesis protein CobT